MASRRAAALAAQQLWRCQAVAPGSSGGWAPGRTAASQWRAFSSLPPHTLLGMPALSPTMTQGNIAAWHVKEGDEVAPGTVLADIETDKATLAFENQDEGFIAKLLVPSGAKDIQVGAPVAIIVEDAEAVPAFASYAAASSSSAPAPAAGGGGAASTSGSQAAAAKPAAAGKAGAPVKFRLGPAARMALAEAGLSPGDITEPSGPNGIITKADVLAAVAAGVKPGSGGSGSGQRQAAAAKPAPAAPQQQRQEEQKPAAAAPAAAQQQPAAAQQQGAGQQQQQQRRPGKGPRVSYTDVPNSQVRRIIAKRLLESKQTIPAIYVAADAPLDAVQALRRQLAEQGVKVSVNDCVIRAAALALRDVPAANAAWDAAAGEVKQQQQVDISIAVATEGGLITPIVRDAANKSLQQISAEVRDLAARARANKLAPEEFTGGTFTISNLGMFGLESFSAIINPPQAAIMAVGGGKEGVKLVDGQPAASSSLTATLSADQRVIGGDVAAALLEAFAGYMAAPVTMLM